MRRLEMHQCFSPRRRPGFTLIELLVIIAIIAFLMALTASAVMKYIQVQQTNNAQQTLNQVQAVLNRAWSAEKDKAWKETIPPKVQQYIQANLAGNDLNATNRTRVIYVKLRMRQVFPMNFNEALNPYPLPALPAYVTYLNQLGVTQSTGAPYESSACLYMALQRAASGGGVKTGDVGGGGATGSFALLPSRTNNIQGFADPWGQPIYFTRVPAGYRQLNPQPYPGPPGPGEPGINDPGDPQGLLNAGGWGTSPSATTFSQLTLQPLAAQNCSYKLMPMVASGGPDKAISDTIWFSATSPVDNDNLYSNP
jgi:prepilin-type N-terminal cleavage/methylation domain-containing protein